MKLLLLSAAVLLTLTPSLRADLLLYEGFNYGSINGALTGKGGGETGLQGTWTDNSNRSFGPATTSYLANGLTFSDLSVTGGSAQMSAQSGGGLGDTAAAFRRLNLATAPTGAIYGSYLFRKATDTSPAAVGTLLFTGSRGDDDNTAKFNLANNEYNTDNAAGRINGTSTVFTGTALELNTTYLFAYKLTGLGSGSQALTGWC